MDNSITPYALHLASSISPKLVLTSKSSQMQVISKCKTKGLLTFSHKPLNRQLLVFFSSSTAFPAISKPTNLTNSSLPNPILTTLSQLLNKHPNLPKLKQIHSQIITHLFSSNSSLVSALIRSYIAARNLVYARILFDSYPSSSPSIVVWNQIIQAYCKTPNHCESIHLFRRLLALDGTNPDKYTCNFVITACSREQIPTCGENVHGLVIKIGCESYIFVGNALANFYSVFSKVGEALKVFDDMPQRDVVTWTSLLSGYTKCGDMGRASELFGEMPERNDVSWAVMISGYVGCGRYYDALWCFHDMLCDDNVKPNEAVFVCVLSACAHLGALDQGKWIHVYIDKSGVFESSNLNTALVNMYTKCGMIDCAKRFFDGATRRDVFTWTGMIVGLSMHGLGTYALQTFYDMLREGIRPCGVTILGVLNGCSHSGLVEEGCSIFDNMEFFWGITPQIEHYGCLVDLLGRAGLLKRAFEVVKSMPMDPDVVIWRTLLSACRIHGDVDLGEQIIGHIITHFDRSVYGEGYMLLSNLYASLGHWDKVDSVRKEMNERKIESNPGGSWIEVDGVIHEFLAVDRLHPCITEVHDMLNEVLKRISIEGGYVVDTKHVLFDLIEEEKDQAVFQHSEKLAVAFGLLSTEGGTPLRIVKNLRICEDCHSMMKAISRVYHREIVVRDRSRFHTFNEGRCSCREYW